MTERMYKPLYLFEFYNTELDEKKYKVLDSLTGDLEDIQMTQEKKGTFHCIVIRSLFDWLCLSVSSILFIALLYVPMLCCA